MIAWCVGWHDQEWGWTCVFNKQSNGCADQWGWPEEPLGHLEAILFHLRIKMQSQPVLLFTLLAVVAVAVVIVAGAVSLLPLLLLLLPLLLLQALLLSLLPLLSCCCC